MLNTHAHMASYDDLYEALIAAHQGLSTDESHALNARLVLLLANHVGDLDVIRDALSLARRRPEVAGAASGAGTVAIASTAPIAPAHTGS